ncbi:MAG: ribosome small subunit-dependent GTPase A [Candidatus Cloacimonetes bacterium]|nr:ribosome small subunit-dependent GTPase A [Candidatus Cloacimonadota bacterium]
MKKRDKKGFKRNISRLTNLFIENIDDFESDEIIQKKAEKKKIEKSVKTLKSDLNLKKGRVIEIKSNNFCDVDLDGEIVNCVIGGRLKIINFETRSLLAIGDWVNVDVSDNPRVEEILPRTNSISRFTEDSYQTEVILAANIDLLVITASYFNPDIRFGLIDRYLCSAALRNIEAIICINKIDLIEDRSIMTEESDFYLNNGYKVIFTSTITGEGINELKELLKDKVSVFSGHSGAGKSSIINSIQPGLNLSVGEISDFTYKGVHTTSASKLFRWDFGGFLIDTPGIKTFGLRNEDKESLRTVFPGFDRFSGMCSFYNCTHTHEENCALKKAVEEDKYPFERYESYLRIYDSLKTSVFK